MAMLCAAVAAQGQYFEWAKGFNMPIGVSRETQVVGTVTDNEGNLYMMVNYRNRDVSYDSQDLTPLTPYGLLGTPSIMIVKITPSGDIAWRKLVNGSNDSYGWDIKKVGDTSFAFMFSTELPYTDNYSNTYLYWLDTLLTGESDYLAPLDNMAFRYVSAYVQMAFDGSVITQHIINITGVDSANHDIIMMINSDPFLINMAFVHPTFDVDRDGNIYICHSSTYNFIHNNLYDGTVSGVKIWVDNHLAGSFIVDSTWRYWHPDVLKFNSNFDTLLCERKLVQESRYEEYDIKIPTIQIDNNNNIHLVGHLDRVGPEPADNIIVIDSSRNISIYQNKETSSVGLLLRLDTNLTPISCLDIHDSIIDSSASHQAYRMIFFKDISFDYDSGLMFVSGCAFQDTLSNRSCFIIDGDLFPVKHDVFVLVLNMNDMHLRSFGMLRSKNESYIDYSSNWHTNHIKSKNNRIFLQNAYIGGIWYPNFNITGLPDNSGSGLSLSIFDYSGALIKGIDYNSVSSNKPGPVEIVDSSLYLIDILDADADFGNMHLSSPGGLTISVAKYVDTRFMLPYIPRTVEIMEPSEGGFVIAPNPAHNEISVMALDAPAKGVFIMSANGKRQEARLHGGKIDISRLPQGVYFLEIVTENDKYTAKFIKI